MVRIKLSHSRKRYLRGKNIYIYLRGNLSIPKKLLARLEPYFEADFQVDVVEDSKKIAVTYTFLKGNTEDRKMSSPQSASGQFPNLNSNR